jgi:hypothetical protein
MKVSNVKTKGTWREVANSANTTINRGEGTKEPTSSWKRRMLLAEHSPIRQLLFKWKWLEIPYFVSVHFVRHKFGIEHWVRTSRSDRTGINRNELPQGNPVEHECEANAQAIINISRKRLCFQASAETRNTWIKTLIELGNKEPELLNVTVPDCIYRGYCYEFKSCGYYKTETYKEELEKYRRGINE